MARERVYTLPFVWSKTVWAYTLIFFAGSVIYIGMLVYLIFNGTTVAAVAGLVVALPVLVGIMIFCEGYSPQRLEISESQITVLRRYDSITIPRSMIVSVVKLEPKDMKRVYTDGGCAGLFGYFGGFRSKQLGRFKMYSTSMDNLYLLTLSDSRKIVIGCTEPKLLL
ncbi:MAG: hypothetical protein E7143_02085 [Rikenellaceae bacterium]|nr:hypothetical protein [Rikenellaceae bacterium]